MSNKIPGKRAMEKATSDLLRLLQGQDINSDDISNYLELSGSKFIHPRGANCLLSWIF